MPVIHIINKLLRLPKVLKGKDFYFSSQIKCPKITFGNVRADWTIGTKNINSDSIIYSVGVGTDISFDLALIQKYNLTIQAFDPTPKSIQWVKNQNISSKFILHEYGLADYDGKAKFNPPENPNHVSHTIVNRQATADKAIEVNVLTLSTIMKNLGHHHIDILKMDIEGAEYAVIDDIVQQKPDIDQILVEFHHRFKPYSVADTKRSVQQLNTAGYKIFHVSATGEEYSFIR